MKNSNFLFSLAVAVLVFAARPEVTSAQSRPDWASMDPQQIQQMIQQRVMDNCRQQLAITNDADWSVIEERLAKVVRARMEVMAGSMGLLGRNRFGGGGGFPGFGQSSPETDALQSAVEAHAPASQIRAALAKYRDAQKRKEADMAKDQDDLRQVITVRQEAVLVSMGLLN